MNLKLFQSYTADELLQYGLVAPSGAEAWFYSTPEGTEYALFFTPDAAECWCYPSISDRNLCCFYSPSRLRLGVDRCQNQRDLLSFRAATFHLPNEHGQVHLFAALPSGKWCYLGQTVLGSGFGTIGSFNQFEIGLDEKLPEWLWLQYGGYRGWLICMYPHQFIIDGAREASSVLNEYWGVKSPTMEIMRYEEDCLSAFTDATGASVVTYHSGLKHLHTVGSGNDGDEEMYGFGDFEFPERWVIPRREAIDLICRYLDTGTPVGLVEG
jgi:hypothetical protein